MIIDFFDSSGDWIDSCHTAHNDAGRVLRSLCRLYGAVKMAERAPVVDDGAIEFGEWLWEV